MGEHDNLFKRAFRLPTHAAGELRSVLPPSVQVALDLDRLQLADRSFVDEALRDAHADLLFRAPLRSKPDEDCLLYFLFEHRSTPTPLLPYFVTRYSCNIWAEEVRERPNRSTLPPVVCLVVHHGADAWPGSRTLHACLQGMDEIGELAPFVPNVALYLDDLGTQSNRALQERPLRAFPKVVLWLLRDGRDVHLLLARMPEWAHELEQLVLEDDTGGDVAVVVRYLYRVAGNLPAEIVRDRVTELVPFLEKPMASAAEQLIQEGRAEGRAEIVLRQLARKFGTLPQALVVRVKTAELHELESWADRLLTAESLARVFED